jgi:hypothetical protein
MGRNKITDGSKKVQAYFLIEGNKLQKIGEKRLKAIIAKAVEKELHNIDKGRVHNQINLIDSIAEIEKNKI